MTDTVRPLRPQEPPPDPDYDNTPTPDQAAAHHAERALLATLLVNPDKAKDILPVLDPTTFHTPAHEHIWTTAADIHARGLIPDHPTLLADLAGNKTFNQAGGVRLLTDLLADAPLTYLPTQTEHHAELIRQGHIYRQADTLLATLRNARRDTNEQTLRETLEKLGDLAHAGAANFGPTTGPTAATGLHDLSWVLTGEPPHVDPPAYVIRTDGTGLFYDGKVNGLFGDPETAKSWCAQVAVIEALHAGGTAAVIDVDHNGADHTAARLLRLGATLEQLADQSKFRYYEPEEDAELRAAILQVTDWAPNVTIIDSLGEILPMLGVSSIDNDEITAALRTVVQPPATAGSCVITIDHLPKSQEARTTGFAIGGTAKKRVIRGAYIRVQSITKPTPGGIGRSSLHIEKDTAGELRRTSGSGYAGTFTLDSTHETITTWRIGREDSPLAPDGTFRPTIIMEKISHYLADNDQATQTQIEKNLGGKATHIRTALQLLIQDGYVSTMPGARRSTLHHLITHYDPREDDKANPEKRPDWGQPRTPDDQLWSNP